MTGRTHGMSEPEQRLHRGRLRYLVEQNVEVEAGDRVQARKPRATHRNWTTAVARLHSGVQALRPLLNLVLSCCGLGSALVLGSGR